MSAHIPGCGNLGLDILSCVDAPTYLHDLQQVSHTILLGVGALQHE